MSYAEAAASSGPIGEGKVPPVPQVKPSSQPKGNIEVVPEEQLKEFKPKVDEAKAKVEDFSKDVEEAAKREEEKGKDFLSKLYAKLSDNLKVANKKITDVGISSFNATKDVGRQAAHELQNPVVIVQTLVGLTGAVTGYYAYLERNRIDYSNKITLGLHAAVITGLVLVDGFLFNKFYPEYKK